MASTQPPPVNMLWMGAELGPIERLSIISFLTAGHPVRLHAYETISNVPDGVEVADAEAAVPQAFMQSLRHAQTGSYALASDFFRFRLQERGAGLWADSDVICLKPILIGGPNIFGFEAEDRVNGAVLLLPRDSRIVDAVLAAFRPGAIPSWLGLNRRRQLWMKRIAGISYGPPQHPWGTFGPVALTALAKKHGVIDQVQPRPVFYPYPWQRAAEIVTPGRSIEEFTEETTLTIHLWNEALGEHRQSRPPSTSALGRLMRDFGV
jgi:hypothetical protein